MFRIRKEPIKPEKRKTHGEIRVNKNKDAATLQDVLDQVPPGIPYEDITIGRDVFEYSVHFYYSVPEPDEVYNRRLEEYKEKKKEYDDWFKANKKEIEKELKRRETAKKEREKKTAEKKLRQLKKKEIQLLKKVKEK